VAMPVNAARLVMVIETLLCDPAKWYCHTATTRNNDAL
jgi:hypothetical protein